MILEHPLGYPRSLLFRYEGRAARLLPRPGDPQAERISSRALHRKGVPTSALKDRSCRLSVFLCFPCRDTRPQEGAGTAAGEGRAWTAPSSPAWYSWLRSWLEVAWAFWSTRLGASSWWSRPLPWRWSAAVLWLSLLDTWIRSINTGPTHRHRDVHGRRSVSFFGSAVLGSAPWMPCVMASVALGCPHLTFCQLSAQQFPDFRHHLS